MKKLLFLFAIISLIFTSCKKEEFKPMEQVPEERQNNTPWENQYGNGGTLPGGGGTNIINDLIGTKWVLTKVVSAFATEYPNDTIEFVTNTHYTLNGGAVRNYQLGTIPSSTNYDLSLYYFAPFGGSHYSGQVGSYFIQDAEINNVEFENIQNTSTTIRAWFIKIN